MKRIQRVCSACPACLRRTTNVLQNFEIFYTSGTRLSHALMCDCKSELKEQINFIRPTCRTESRVSSYGSEVVTVLPWTEQVKCRGLSEQPNDIRVATKSCNMKHITRVFIRIIVSNI